MGAHERDELLEREMPPADDMLILRAAFTGFQFLESSEPLDGLHDERMRTALTLPQ